MRASELIDRLAAMMNELSQDPVVCVADTDGLAEGNAYEIDIVYFRPKAKAIVLACDDPEMGR